MASSMQSGEVIQEVKSLPRAQASHRPGSATRWREETNVSSRVEQVSRVGIEPRKWFASRGPARDNHPRRPAPRVWEPRTVSRRWHAVSAPSLSARRGRGPRGRRPDQADQGRTRERVRASSASGLSSAEQCGATCAAGSPPRAPSAPRQGPRPRRGDPSSKTRGRQGRRDKRERAGTPDGRSAGFAEQRRDGLNVFPRKRARGRRRAPPA
jgi:hypothetical protein